MLTLICIGKTTSDNNRNDCPKNKVFAFFLNEQTEGRKFNKIIIIRIIIIII